MLIATGTVIDGKVVVDGVSLNDGETVTVLVRDAGQPVQLTADEAAELLAAADDAERGATISAEDLLASLRRR